MIKMLKTLFSKKTQCNTIAASIEIKEMPAKTWWS
jgi:hypothetical protein